MTNLAARHTPSNKTHQVPMEVGRWCHTTVVGEGGFRQYPEKCYAFLWTALFSVISGGEKTFALKCVSGTKIIFLVWNFSSKQKRWAVYFCRSLISKKCEHQLARERKDIQVLKLLVVIWRLKHWDIRNVFAFSSFQNSHFKADSMRIFFSERFFAD